MFVSINLKWMAAFWTQTYICLYLGGGLVGLRYEELTTQLYLFSRIQFSLSQ